jgi:hypothetical protein
MRENSRKRSGPRTIRGQTAIRSSSMVFAPGGGRGPLPIPVAIGFLLVGPLLLWFAYKGATEDPKPVIVTCTRERADLIACQPGNVRGPQVIARRQTGKNAQSCFTLGDTWMKCGGDVYGGAARVNALAVGAKTDVDLTPPKGGAGLWTGAVLAVLMIVLGVHRLMKAFKS